MHCLTYDTVILYIKTTTKLTLLVTLPRKMLVLVSMNFWTKVHNLPTFYVNKNNRNYSRCLWFHNILDQSKVVVKFFTWRIIGVSCSPFCLICTTWKHKFHKDFADNLLLPSSFLLRIFLWCRECWRSILVIFKTGLKTFRKIFFYQKLWTKNVALHNFINDSISENMESKLGKF